MGFGWKISTINATIRRGEGGCDSQLDIALASGNHVLQRRRITGSRRFSRPYEGATQSTLRVSPDHDKI